MRSEIPAEERDNSGQKSQAVIFSLKAHPEREGEKILSVTPLVMNYIFNFVITGFYFLQKNLGFVKSIFLKKDEPFLECKFCKNLLVKLGSFGKHIKDQHVYCTACEVVHKKFKLFKDCAFVKDYLDTQAIYQEIGICKW